MHYSCLRGRVTVVSWRAWVASNLYGVLMISFDVFLCTHSVEKKKMELMVFYGCASP